MTGLFSGTREGVKALLSPARVILKNVSYRTGQTRVAIGSLFCGPYAYACAAAGSYENARVHGASNSDAIRAGVISGVTTYIGTEGNNWAGNIGQEYGEYGVAHFAAHAMVGCAASAVGGGSCKNGAVSGMTGLAGTPYGFVGAVVAGGVGSTLAGGKFGDGAVTAAYGYLFNYCSHNTVKCSIENWWDSSVAGFRSEGPLDFAKRVLQAFPIESGLTGVVGGAVRTDSVLWTKMLASDAQVAELLSSGGRAIAGAGTDTLLRDAPRLAATYGGEASDWAKVSSSVYKAADGLIVETHAYLNTVTKQIVEFKSKVGF